MPTADGPLRPSHKWYKIGFEDLWKVKTINEEIQIFSAPCYLATKFEAYNGRGSDYRTSHDFEDIIYVLDNRISIVEEIIIANKKIIEFLKSEIYMVLNSQYLEEIISSHIHPMMLEERQPLIIEKMRQIMKI